MTEREYFDWIEIKNILLHFLIKQEMMMTKFKSFINSMADSIVGKRLDIVLYLMNTSKL